jgi:tRNA threonylcarbamoyl adenosine modification protein (Sua5/YciO/YrdC/YwlC family)
VSQVFEVDPRNPNASRAPLEAAAGALAEGQLVVLPTETIYGIAARPDDPSATARVFSAKRRPSGLNLPVLTAMAEGAWEVGVPDERAIRLAAAFWPGPLTMVLPRSDHSRAWKLGEQRDSIALRVPDHALTSRLIAQAGPLAATSANVSGRPPLSDRSALVGAFGDAVAVYLVLAPGAAPPGGTASTVVDLTGPTMRILRPGPISPEQIEAAAAGQ